MRELNFDKITVEESEIRVGMVSETMVQLLLSRQWLIDQKRLNEHPLIGPMNWKDRYESTKDGLFCYISIFDPDKNEWVEKGNAGDSDGKKATASDAFKRACSKWGIATELYTAGNIYVPNTKATITRTQNGRFVCRDEFYIDVLEYEKDRISNLRIINKTLNVIAFELNHGTKASKGISVREEIPVKPEYQTASFINNQIKTENANVTQTTAAPKNGEVETVPNKVDEAELNTIVTFGIAKGLTIKQVIEKENEKAAKFLDYVKTGTAVIRDDEKGNIMKLIMKYAS